MRLIFFRSLLVVTFIHFGKKAKHSYAFKVDRVYVFCLSISLKVIENLTKGRLLFSLVAYLVIVLPLVSRHYYRFVPEIQSFDKSKCTATQPATHYII